MKAAHVVASCAAWQEIRVRSGRDDKFVEPFTGARPLDNQAIYVKQICHLEQPTRGGESGKE
jgi:hypothetical protein